MNADAKCPYCEQHIALEGAWRELVDGKPVPGLWYFDCPKCDERLVIDVWMEPQFEVVKLKCPTCKEDEA